MTGWGSAFAGLPFGGAEPPAVLDRVLARIAAVDGDLSAFVAIDADRARPAAAPADARVQARPVAGHLLGVPIVVKE
jgi:Asp-tRNA(Asn)/Glu-tRNA(Gln) amidotransferase A subunit family amidase